MNDGIHLPGIPVCVAALVMITGCSAGGQGQHDTGRIARDQIADLPARWQAVGNTADQDVAHGWIKSFKNQTLMKLVDEALVNNRSLRQAALNVERSRLLVRQAGAALVPQINATAGTSFSGRFEGADSATRLEASAQASWEIDLWGRLRAGQRSAVFGAQASEADLRYARLSIVAAVARAWIAAISAQQQREISASIVDGLGQTSRIVGIRRQEGLASAKDFAIAAGNLASAQDTLVAAAAARRNALRAIEVLIGRYPSADLEIGAVLPSRPPDPPVGLPSGVLERRPDLIAAERRIAAAFNISDQARAARLPGLSLTANAGAASSELAQILNPINIAWRAAASLLAPIIDGGRRKIQVQIATVDQRLAIESYADAALNAFSEVEKALDDGQTLRQRQTFVTQARQQSDEALRLARFQYEEGEIDLLSVIQLEQSAFAARSDFLTVNRLALEQYVNLSLALGGHWRTASKPDS